MTQVAQRILVNRSPAWRRRPAGLNFKSCWIIIIYLQHCNFWPYWHIQHYQHFEINHNPSSMTSHAALRRRQRRDQARILWVLLQKHDTSASRAPEEKVQKHRTWDRNWALTTKTHLCRFFHAASLSEWPYWLSVFHGETWYFSLHRNHANVGLCVS